MWSPPPTVPSSTGLGPFPARARRLGFFERLRIGWQLTKVSLSILRREKGLILLPFLSLLTTGVAWILFFLGIFFFVPDPTISDGLKVANENLRRIAGWALLSATVGLILRAIADRAGIIGRIIAGFAGAAWGVITYLVVPVLIFEKVGPWAAVKRSGSLLRKTWGEAMGGYFSLGAIFLLLALPGLLLLLGGVAIGGIVGLLIGGAVAVVYWLILGLLGAAAQSILVTALYRYATTGKLGFGFPEGLLATGTAASR